MWALRRNHGSCQPRWAVSPFLTGNGDATRTQPSTLKTNAQRQSVNRVSIVLMLRLHRVERIIRAIRTIPNEAYEANPIWPFVFKNAQARKSRAIHDLFPNQHRVGRAPSPVHRPQVGRGPGQTTNPIFPFVFNKSESGKPISNRGGSYGAAPRPPPRLRNSLFGAAQMQRDATRNCKMGRGCRRCRAVAALAAAAPPAAVCNIIALAV